MTSKIKTIDELIIQFKKLLPIKKEIQSILDKKFRLEFNYNSNHIEGNTLTFSETELLLIFDETKGNHTKREYDEMQAHDVAFKLIKEWAEVKERPLTETNIKNLNEIILVKPFWKEAVTPDGQKTRRLIKVGDYKEYPNSVRLSNGEIFEYASVIDTPILMGELLHWYQEVEKKEELHPIELAALLSYKFVRIHPFDDGNGRIARLLMNYVLLNNDLPPIVIKSIDKRKYLSALNSADAGDINAFVNYIAEQLRWSLELTIKAAKGESIEEVDDIDKEIDLFKKQVVGKVKKSHPIISELYFSLIKNIFDELEQKHKKLDDLFSENIYRRNINSGHPTNYYDNFLDGVMEGINSNKGESVPYGNSEINSIGFGIDHKNYQKDGLNIFDCNYSVTIKLDDYQFHISTRGSNNFSFVYDQHPDKEEIKQIVADIMKVHFDELKLKLKK